MAQAVRDGRLTRAPGSGLLARLPRAPWALGLALGVGAACLLVPLTWALFPAPVPFAGMALYKACYTATLGYLVTRGVILRQAQE